MAEEATTNDDGSSSDATGAAANPTARNNIVSPHPSPPRTLSHIHVHLNTPEGVRGVNIPLPPGVTMPQRVMVQQQGGGGGGGTSSTNNFQPQTIHIRRQTTSSSSAMLPYQPLQAQPLPNQINYDDVILLNQNNNLQQQQQQPLLDLKKFECSICFEYMEVPVRCGGEATCSSRFCAPCLSRVLREEISNRNNRNNTEDSSLSSSSNQSAKCPHCRTNFTQSDIQIDHSLQTQINDSTNTITCPFKGCNTEIPIGQLKRHEESCSYIRMKCRYAEWGCNWTGRKMDLQSHYDAECEFTASCPGLATFIERYRKTVEHDHRYLIDTNRSQIQGVTQMQSIQSRQVMMVKSRNAADIVDVIALSYNACCFTGRFVDTRDLWSSILLKQGCRATMGNMLLSFPTMVLVASVFIQCIGLLRHPQVYVFGTEPSWQIADTILMGAMMLILGIIYLSCFYIDVKSPYEWTLFSLKNVCASQPIIRDIAAICIAMIYFLAFEHFEFIRGVIMWHAMMFSTVFYTSFVMRMADKVGGSATPQPRTWSVIVFGLRYGLIASYCDFKLKSPVACFFGVVVWMRLLKLVCKLPEIELIYKLPDFVTCESSECFFKQGYPAVLVGGATVWLGYMSQSDGTTLSDVIGLKNDCFYGTLLLVYTNFIVYVYKNAGAKLAEFTYSTAIHANRAHPGSFPNPIGCIVFGLSNCLLMGVAFMLNVRY